MVRERLPAAVLIFWSRRDAVCWPGGQPKETTGESIRWRCRDDNCRSSACRLVGRVAAAVELGGGLRHHETGDSLVPHGPRSRARAPWQELALRIRGRPRGGGRRRA